MKYMLLMYWNQAEVPQSTPAEQAEQFKAWQALTHEMQAAGVLLAYNGLAPVTTASTVRVRDGKTVIGDGPFAETHEQLGGFFLVECPNIDEAIGWAAKIPAAKNGTIEVRPLWNSSQQ